jgi:hypothetical protein
VAQPPKRSFAKRVVFDTLSHMLEQFRPLRPPERIPSSEEKQAEDEMSEADELAIYAAKEYQLRMPRVGTPAFRRIVDTAQEYARRVEYQAESPLVTQDDRRQSRSDQERRILHNVLCKMFFGKEYDELSKRELNRISNFAVTVAKLDKYIDTF